MDQYVMSATLPVQQEMFNQQSLGRAHTFSNSTNLNRLFQNPPVTSTAVPLSPFRSNASYLPQNISHERNSISYGPPHTYQSHQSIYGSPALSAISQGQPHCTASQPSSPYESRSSSVSAGRLPVRPGTDSPTSNSLPFTRNFSVTSQPMRTVSIVEDAFTRQSPDSMKTYQLQQQENQSQQKHQQQILSEPRDSILQTSDASPTADYPLRVVGKQGVRGILPSLYDGSMLNPEKLQPALAKDESGKYPCSHCQKTYLHAKHLKRHLLRHFGIRPYACYLCRDTFSRSDILKRHFQKCSQRRGNPGGQDHLAEKRRKNRSYSTMERSWRSANRSASGSREVSYGSATRSLSSVASTIAAIPTRSSIQSHSTPSSRSSSLLRAGNNSETGRRMSSVEFINQQQQQQQHQQQRQLQQRSQRIGYQSSPAMSDFSFSSTSTANSTAALVESLAAYSMPRDHYKSGGNTMPVVYGLNSSVSDTNLTSYAPGSTGSELVNDSKEANGLGIGLQRDSMTNILTERDLNRRNVSNAIAEHFLESKGQGAEETSHPKNQQEQVRQNSMLFSAGGTAVNINGTAVTSSTSSSYRPNSDTRATAAITGIGTRSPLPNDTEGRTAWPSMSSLSCASATPAMLAPLQHAPLSQDQLNYSYRHQPHQDQDQQNQQQQRRQQQQQQEQQQQQQQYLKPEQHHYYQHQMNPYEFDAHMRSEILTYDQ